MDSIPHLLTILIVVYQYQEGYGKCWSSQGCLDSACDKNQRAYCKILRGHSTGACACEDKLGECAVDVNCSHIKCAASETFYCDDYERPHKCKCKNKHQCDHDSQCGSCAVDSGRIEVRSGFCNGLGHTRKCLCGFGGRIKCKNDKECREHAGRVCDDLEEGGFGLPVCYDDNVCGCARSGTGHTMCKSDKDCKKMKCEGNSEGSSEENKEQGKPVCSDRNCECVEED